jgi:hypothetical protein
MAAEKACHAWGNFDETLKIRVDGADRRLFAAMDGRADCSSMHEPT